MTISVPFPMQKRLDNLEQHLKRNNLRVAKRWVCPVLRSNESNRNRPFTYFGQTATGFSWIAFFFPYAVCSQIRESSFFAFQAVVYIITAWMHVIMGVDLSFGVGIGISIIYGYCFPYLRYLVLKENRKEYAVFNQSYLVYFYGLLPLFLQ